MKNRNLGRDKLTKNKSTAQAQNGAGGVGKTTEYETGAMADMVCARRASAFILSAKDEDLRRVESDLTERLKTCPVAERKGVCCSLDEVRREMRRRAVTGTGPIRTPAVLGRALKELREELLRRQKASLAKLRTEAPRPLIGLEAERRMFRDAWLLAADNNNLPSLDGVNSTAELSAFLDTLRELRGRKNQIEREAWAWARRHGEPFPCYSVAEAADAAA